MHYIHTVEPPRPSTGKKRDYSAIHLPKQLMGGNRASLLPSSLGNECAPSSSANFPEAQFRPSPPRVIIIPTCKVEDGTVELSHFHTADRGQEKETRDISARVIGIFTKNLFSHMWESTWCVGRFFIGIPSDLSCGRDRRSIPYLSRSSSSSSRRRSGSSTCLLNFFLSLLGSDRASPGQVFFLSFFKAGKRYCPATPGLNWGGFSFFLEHSFCPPLSFAPNWD